MPKISVILTAPSPNEATACAIQSVLTQTESDFELIIVDPQTTLPGSTDSLGDDRVRRITCVDDVRPENAGLRVAAGRYVAYLEAADLWHPAHLAKLRTALEDADAELASSLFEWLDPAPGGRRFLSGLEGSPAIAKSALMHLRVLSMEIGEWGSDIFSARAQAAGKKLVPVKALTAFGFATASPEVRREYLRRMDTEPDFASHELIAIVAAMTGAPTAAGATPELQAGIMDLAQILRAEIARPHPAPPPLRVQAENPHTRAQHDQERFLRMERIFALALESTRHARWIDHLRPRQKATNLHLLDLLTNLFELYRELSYDILDVRLNKESFQRDLSTAHEQLADRFEEHLHSTGR